MDFLQYFYVFLWAALAIMVAVIGRKEGLLAIVMTSFFIFMAAWFGLRAFGGIAMFDGALGVAFRCVLAVYAVALGVIWFIKRRREK